MTTPGRTPAAGRRRRRTQSGTELSKDLYVDAAVNLIEQRGADVLSARTLASAVGADASALYRYFDGVDNVLLAVADRMIGIALDRWTPVDDWLISLRDLARSLYTVYAQEFPRTGIAIASRTTGLPNEIRAVEVTLALLRKGGFDDESAARCFRSLSDFLLGQAMLTGAFSALPVDTQRADDGAWRELPERIPAGAAPHTEAAAHYLSVAMTDDSFDASLELVMRGLAATPRRATG